MNIIKKYRNSFITYIIAILFFSLDQLTKTAVYNSIPLQNSKVVFPWLWLTHVENYGAAFSSFYGQRVLLCIFAGIISTGMIIYEIKTHFIRTKLLSFSLGFLLAGAVGNLYDRTKFGKVTDFLDLRYNAENIWPIFNVADISINVGIGLLILFYIFQDGKTKTNPDKTSDEESVVIETNSPLKSDTGIVKNEE